MTARDMLPPPLTLAILVACGLVGFEAISQLPETSTKRALWAPPTAETSEPLTLVSADAESEALFDAVARRPIFAETRRPHRVERPPVQPAMVRAPVSEPTGAPAQIARPDWELVGVVASAAERKALIRDKTNDTESWVSVGATLDGWTVTSIDAAVASIEQGDIAHELQLFK